MKIRREYECEGSMFCDGIAQIVIKDIFEEDWIHRFIVTASGNMFMLLDYINFYKCTSMGYVLECIKLKG